MTSNFEITLLGAARTRAFSPASWRRSPGHFWPGEPPASRPWPICALNKNPISGKPEIGGMTAQLMLHRNELLFFPRPHTLRGPRRIPGADGNANGRVTRGAASG